MLSFIVAIKITLSKYLSYYICYLLQSLFSQLLGQEAHGGPALYGCIPLKFPLSNKTDICRFLPELISTLNSTPC